MFHSVLSAFFGASTGDLGANVAEVRGKLRTAGHEPSRHSTDDRALPIQIDTTCHHLHLVLLQTGAGAVFALAGAPVTGFDTGTVFVVHNVSPLCASFPEPPHAIAFFMNDVLQKPGDRDNVYQAL
jgi:hypothetical protein